MRAWIAGLDAAANCVRRPLRRPTVFDQASSNRAPAAFVWGSPESKFVIRPDSPELNEPYLEKLHFLLAIIFRVMICGAQEGG